MNAPTPASATFTTPLRSRRASRIPGDTERILTRAAIDTDGNTWSAGTRYRPRSVGNDGQRVSILR